MEDDRTSLSLALPRQTYEGDTYRGMEQAPCGFSYAPAPPSGRAPHLVPFTPLRAPPSDILAYAEECHLVRTPDPHPNPSGADMSKYCKYHRCHGHNTNDCQAWRKEIERLIQAGKLGNFIDWDRMAKRDTRGRGATPQMPQTGKERDSDEPNRPVINVIFGGEALGGQAFVGAVDDRPATKKPRREPIWSRGTIICTPSPSHSSREFNSGCVSFDRTPRGTVGSRLRPWVENGSEVCEEDGGLVVRERVSIIVGMVCIGVKGERVIPKVPKPVLGGEITMGSVGVRERGGMSCGGEADDRGEAAGSGAARAGEDSFGCCIAIWPCGCRGLRIAVAVRCASAADWCDGRAAERTDDGSRWPCGAQGVRTGAIVRLGDADCCGLVWPCGGGGHWRIGVTVRRGRLRIGDGGEVRALAA
nr:uncharacterized protein LOC109171091 [Ipomoea batatas]